MSAFATLLAALALVQGEPKEPPPELPPAEIPATPIPTTPIPATPVPEPTPPAAIEPLPSRPLPPPTGSGAARTAPAAPPSDVQRAPARAPDSSATRPAPPAEPAPAVAPAPPPTSTPPPTRRAESPTPVPVPVAEKDEEPATEAGAVERAARAFLEALRSSDLEALVAASPGRFDFDGETQVGADAIRRAWRAILAARDAPAPPLAALEVLTAADAIARHGKPPRRIAGLARPGTWVAIADLGGRPVVLFLSKDGARPAVLGLHD